jgi:trimeric autotransporter adhesin
MRHMKALRALLVVSVGVLTLISTPSASAQATPCADLLITDIAFSPAMPVQGQQANISITVRNAGTCAAGGFVVQFKTDLFAPTGPSRSVNGLGPGASTSLNLSFNFAQAGNFQTVVQVDTGNAVSETNEVNNLEIEAVTVLPPGVNLVIDQFTLAPDPVVQGRVATATIRVTNTGNVPAGSFRVEWTPFFLAAPLSRQINGLAPGASTNVTFDFTFPFAGTVGGVAVVDAGNAIFETNEFDNVSTLQTVVEPPLPNLRVSNVNTVPAPAGSVSRIDITVVNDGNNPAGDFVVRWEPGFLQAPLTRQVNGLAVGASTVVSFDVTFPFAGTFDGTITVDSTAAVAEVDETDNTRATRFEIPVATVDLTIDSLTINPASPVQGASATATVVVRNLGNSPSGRFVVDWNPDAFGIIVPSVQTLSEETGPLGPGATRAITFSFTYPQAGNFRTIANVDSFNTVAETNEANNQRILNVTVQPAPIDLVFVGGITFNPAQPVRGVNATASVTVRNDGPIATGPFAVQLKAQENDFFPQTQFVNGLNPGESRTLTYTVNYANVGTFTATATLDVFSQVNEAAPGGEGNNVLNQSVTVRPQTLRVTVNSIHVNNDGDDIDPVEDWIVLSAVLDAEATCNAFGQSIPGVRCRQDTVGNVDDGDDIGIGFQVDTPINSPFAPVVAAVAAVDVDLLGAEFMGVAPLIALDAASVANPTVVDSQEGICSPCFTASFSAQVLNPPASLAARRAGTDARSTAPRPAISKARRATMTRKLRATMRKIARAARRKARVETRRRLAAARRAAPNRAVARHR